MTEAKTKSYTLSGSAYKTNWPLLLLIFLIPLRNIQIQYLPNLGGGLNALNVLFLLALFHSMMHGRKYETSSGINGIIIWYILSGVLALMVGYGYLQGGAEGNWKAFKDQCIPLLLVMIIQKSAADGVQWRRILIAGLLSVPYCARLVWDQYKSVASFHYSDDLRIKGPFMDLGANEMGAYSVTLTLLAVALLISVWQQPRWRNFFLFVLFCSGICVLYSYSRGAYVSVLLGLIVILVKSGKLSKVILPAILVSIISLPLLPASVTERFSTISSEEDERDESAQSRFVFWEIALNKWKERPFLGFGYKTADDETINPHQMDTHNYYVKVIVERGIIGSIMLILLLMAVWKLTKRNLIHNRNEHFDDDEDEEIDTGDPFAQGVALGMHGIFAALLLANMFGDRFSHYPVLTIFWTLVGLIAASQLHRNEPQENADDTEQSSQADSFQLYGQNEMGR